MNDLKKCKADLIRAAHKVIEAGLNFGTWGNMSCRGAGNQVIITPSGIPYADLQSEDLCVVNLEGEVMQGHWKPSTELPLHLAIYKARQEMDAIVHVHSKYASAFAVARKEIPIASEEMAQLLGMAVPVADYALPGSDLLGKNTVTALGNGYAALLASHGLVAAGSLLDEALLRCLVIERSARVLLFSRLLGNPVLLDKDEIIALHNKYTHSYGQEKK